MIFSIHNRLTKLIITIIIVILSIILSYIIFHIFLPEPYTSDSHLTKWEVSYPLLSESNLCKKIFRDGLYDIDIDSIYDCARFEILDKIKSVKGYCFVSEGYVEVKNQKNDIFGGSNDLWEDDIKYELSESSSLLQDPKPYTDKVTLPLSIKDLHSIISVKLHLFVEFPVEYPAKIGKFYNSKGELFKQYNLYIITPDDLEFRKKYEIWAERHYYFTLYSISIIIIVGIYFIFFERQNMFYNMANKFFKTDRFKRRGN